jgi:hypothetical protein
MIFHFTEKLMALYLMSTTVIPSGSDGTWEFRSVSNEEARKFFVSAEEAISAIGHASTAEAISSALGAEVKMNRITVNPEVGDYFLCFRLNSRPPEGAILDLETLKEIGFGWAIMHYKSA